MAGRLLGAARFVRRFVLPAAVGLTGAWLGLSVLGRDVVSMGPFRVELESQFGRGRTEIALPPLGRLRADTHFAPIGLRATLVDAGIEELAERFRNRSTSELVDVVQRDALDRLGPFAWRLLAAGAGGALVLAAAVYRRRVGSVAIAVAAAVVAVGGAEGLARATFRPAAFASPTFFGSLSLAPSLVGPVEEATGRIDDLRAELTRIVDGALRVYAGIPAGSVATADAIAVLHISDVHLSPLGLEFARQVAEGFDVDLVIDTGDLTSFGTSQEAAVLSLVRRLGRPYVLARGNHDAPGLASAVEAIEGAHAPDGEVVTVAGITVYGRAHPAQTQDQVDPVDDDDVEELARREADVIAADLAQLDEPPDVVAVHDDRMVDALAGAFPLAISGHFHHASAREESGTIFLRTGTTGGAGFTVFTAEGGIPLSLQVLYLSREAPHRLFAWDVIEQSPETGSLFLERHRVAEEFGELEPQPAPSG